MKQEQLKQIERVVDIISKQRKIKKLINGASRSSCEHFMPSDYCHKCGFSLNEECCAPIMKKQMAQAWDELEQQRKQLVLKIKNDYLNCK